MTTTQRWIICLMLWCVWFAFVMAKQIHERAAMRNDFAHAEYLLTNSIPQ